MKVIFKNLKINDMKKYLSLLLVAIIGGMMAVGIYKAVEPKQSDLK